MVDIFSNAFILQFILIGCFENACQKFCCVVECVVLLWNSDPVYLNMAAKILCFCLWYTGKMLRFVTNVDMEVVLYSMIHQDLVWRNIIEKKFAISLLVLRIVLLITFFFDFLEKKSLQSKSTFLYIFRALSPNLIHLENHYIPNN